MYLETEKNHLYVNIPMLFVLNFIINILLYIMYSIKYSYIYKYIYIYIYIQIYARMHVSVSEFIEIYIYFICLLLHGYAWLLIYNNTHIA